MEFHSPQEEFWAGEFGQSYIFRNNHEQLLPSAIAFFANIFSSAGILPLTCLELGANIGINIRAIQMVSPNTKLSAIEINKEASEILATTGCEVFASSIFNTQISRQFDFVFSKGVLIHLPPEQLGLTYKKMYDWSKRFILISEYYNPEPVEIDYRGNSGRLFKRDFAGEFMDQYPDVEVRDCGFVYHRGVHPQDDITWFLLEKISVK